MPYWLLIVLLAVALVVGPIMFLQPSVRDRRLIKLRQQAAELGLKIYMADYAVGNQREDVAVYSLISALPKTTPSWCLLRRSFQHDAHFHHDWDWSQDIPTLSAEEQQSWKYFLDQLPQDIVGVEVDNKHLGVWWRELSNDITPSDILSWLKEKENLIKKINQ